MTTTMKSPTVSSLAELAKLAGVSASTVSRSLAGNPMIAEATRTRITQLAAEHGFQINQSARNLRLKRTGAIGVVLPLGHETAQRLSDPFFMSLIGPLADALAGRGFTGRVERLAPAAGSEFAVLKQDNATGNFVKIPQRIGVRIAIDPRQPDIGRLLPGMSVEVRIDTGPAR